jgi:hypothetical protein
VVEGNQAQFTVTLDRMTDPSDWVNINYTTTDGSATAGSDYTGIIGTLAIGPNKTSEVVLVDTTHDIAVEIDEDFTLDFTNVGGPADNVTLTANQGTATITNNDYAVVSVSNPVVVEGNTATFTVTLDRVVAGGESVSIDYTTTDGSANAGSDYTAVIATLTIPAGDISGIVSVDTTPDTIVEADEDFTLDLSNVGGPADNVEITAAQGTATITDNDNYQISVDDVTVDESGATATFTVSLDQAGDVDVSLDYATTDGSAVQPGDYTATSGTLTILAVSNSGTISVPILEDALVENDETFTVTLSNVVGPGVLADATGIGTITDNDQYSIAIANAPDVVEGNQSLFAVTVSPAIHLGATVTVEYSTSNGTATAPGDYAAETNTILTITVDGTTQVFATVNTVNDNVDENTEDFGVTLSNASSDVGAAAINAAADTATANILDNDHTLTIDKAGSAADADCTLTASAGNPSGTGGGSTSSFPVSYVYEDGDTVILTATETTPVQGSPGTPGSIFLGWSGDLSGTNNPESIIIDSDKTVTAAFNTSYVLTIDKAGSGAAVSTVAPAPGDHVYEAGTVVNLTATDTAPAAGSIFVDWDCRFGDCPASVLANPTDPVNATITVNENTYVTANFDKTVGFTLTNPGTGSGTVKWGIDGQP